MRSENIENTIAEKIAKIALMRTGLVTVREDHDHRFKCDIVVYNENQPNKVLLVEVKQMSGSNISKESVTQKYQSFFSSIASKSAENPYIVFFIEGVTEKGYFEIFEKQKGKGLERLRMDSLSGQLSELLKSFSGIEYPPYSFYQRDKDAKYKTSRIMIDDEYRYLRLINLTLSPIDKNSYFTIEVIIEKSPKKQTKRFRLDELFYNPNLNNFLFFINPNTREQTGDILLPPGNKYVTIRVKSESDVKSNFEMKLACRFLRHQNEMSY